MQDSANQISTATNIIFFGIKTKGQEIEDK